MPQKMLDLGAMGIATSLASARRFSLRITAAFHEEPPPTYMQWTAGGLAPGLPKI
jgi:hypothetical protein